MASASEDIECEFCGLKNDKIVDPKKLPCGHINCMPCLTSHYKENEIFWCGLQSCGKVYKMSPEMLPDFDDAQFCDTCVKKGQNKRQAVSYCTDCSRKFCTKHLEQHDGVLEDHHTIPMAQYLSKASPNLPEICTKHDNQPLVVGCKVCHTISCMKCVADSTRCDKGGPHDFQLLEDLAASLLSTMITVESAKKDEEYEKLFKEVSKVQSDYDAKTESMLKLIRKTRESQLNAVKLKYDTLERQVLENRQESQTKIADFIEDVLLKQWNSLRTHQELLETGTKSHSPAAIVRGFNELKAQLDKITQEHFPKLKLTDHLQLKQIGERRDIELEVTSSHDIVFEQKASPVQLPKSLTKLSSIQLPSCPLSICHYKGNTYVGLDYNTVSRVDADNKITNKFISASGPVTSVTCYKERIYTLSGRSPHTVGVYSMSGKLITSWKHPDHGYFSDMLVIIEDKVLITDPSNTRITTYSLDGQVLHHTPCPLLAGSHSVRMCAPDNNSLIISSSRHSKVFKIDRTTQGVMWTLTEVENPQGLGVYGEYILLAAVNNKTIYIINSTTGKIVSQMAHDDIARGGVFSLEVYGSTLLVPKHDSEDVTTYKMT
ncbi:uncharacterized protein [Watersipora subatra]|uniref:uncharacterized protein n=1 Tax=Watersipora subatra TaxID=2589382 RepID=UPI00355BFBB5